MSDQEATVGVCWTQAEKTILVPHSRVIEIVTNEQPPRPGASDCGIYDEDKTATVTYQGKDGGQHTVTSEPGTGSDLLYRGFWYIGEVKPPQP